MARRRIDTAEWEALRVRMQERRWLLAAAVIVLLGLLLTYHAKTRSFQAEEGLLTERALVNLNALESSEALIPVFASIYSDSLDRRLAAEHTYACITRRQGRLLPWSLPNVGLLNTAAFALPAERAEAGGVLFKKRQEEAQGAHSVGLLGGTADLLRLKPQVVVRSPTVYRRTFWGLVGLFMGAFFGLHLFWFRRRFRGDPALLPVVLLLAGLGLILMFSLQDPLRDLLLAQGFVGGVAGGCLLLGATSTIDFQRRFWRRRTFVWLTLGVLTAAVLYAVGTGPTGSGAKVNLYLPWFGSVQPVEGIKLLLVLFMAGYFARNWAFLRKLKQREGLPRLLRRLDIPRYRDLFPVAGGILVALLTFYVLRDMGPALVVGCTFLALYGVARRRWLAVGVGLLAMVASFWAAYRSGAVPVVAGRVQMLLSPWENFVVGGEHLAHAYWALAAGGVAGQGLGAGEAQHIPAAHTDMVLAVLGEEAGLLGLAAVFVLYAVLLGRAFQISLRAGGVYSLFLSLGVTLLLFFQVALIAGGALGLLPLSGVATPFLSYGKSSMIANCILVGMLMSVSARAGTTLQGRAQRHYFRRPVQYLTVAMGLMLGALAAKSVYVQVVRADAWTLKPALVLQGSGERAYLYNPRIFAARRQLTRGTIYDRNGMPLATSRWEELEQFRAHYAALGVDVDHLPRIEARYYPFGALTFYLLGDVRTRVKWGARNSLYAEHLYLSHLRGYDNRPQPVLKQRTEQGAAEPVVRYHYGELLPLLRHGARSTAARALLARNRDLYLTIDVRLQQRLAEVMADKVPEGKTASAVVLDAATGDVLASVTYPLPERAFATPAAAHLDQNLFDRGYGMGAKPPGSTFKLVTAIAAFNTRPQANRWTYTVRAYDRYARLGEPTGKVDMARAVIASSNVYFAALAREVVGADSLLRALEAFGFHLGRAGLSLRQKLDLLRAPDNLRQAGFGQGPVTASPLQVALVAATIANGGARPDVRWVRTPLEARRPPRYVMDPHHARMLARYMRGVVTDPEGTARALQAVRLPVAGKTGTAEERELITADGRSMSVTVNHAWFAGFAPYQEPGAEDVGPQIAIAVLVENGGSGGHVAAPIAGAIVEEAAILGLIGRD